MYKIKLLIAYLLIVFESLVNARCRAPNPKREVVRNGRISGHGYQYSKCAENPNNKSKQTQSQLVFEKDPTNEGEARLRSWVLNPHKAKESIPKIIIIDELPFRFVENMGLG